MERPEVSVVIPTKDRRDLLARTLLSVLGQRDVRTEVILVDDGSRVAVSEVLSDEALERVRVVRHARSRGVSEARNAGIDAATGEWIAFLDDDDLWAPEKLRTQLDAASAAGAEFAYSGGIEVDAEGTIVAIDYVPPVPTLRTRMLEAHVIPYSCSNVVARTDVVREVARFDPRFHQLADWEMALRLVTAATGAAVEDYLIAYVLHETNMHASEAGHWEERERLVRKHAAAYAASGAALDEAGWLAWVARGRRLGGDRSGAARGYAQLAWMRKQPSHLARALVLAVAGEPGMEAIHRLRTRTGLGPAPPAWFEGVFNPPPERLRGLLREP